MATKLPAAALKPQPWFKASDLYHISENIHSHRRDGPAFSCVFYSQTTKQSLPIIDEKAECRNYVIHTFSSEKQAFGIHSEEKATVIDWRVIVIHISADVPGEENRNEFSNSLTETKQERRWVKKPFWSWKKYKGGKSGRWNYFICTLPLILFQSKTGLSRIKLNHNEEEYHFCACSAR